MFVLSKDGRELCRKETYNDCLVRLQREVPYSWDHAMKYEGWTIEPAFVVDHCDGSGPHTGDIVKRYPMGGRSALILCHHCWGEQNKYRYERGKEAGRPEKWPQENWNDAEIYGEE